MTIPEYTTHFGNFAHRKTKIIARKILRKSIPIMVPATLAKVAPKLDCPVFTLLCLVSSLNVVPPLARKYTVKIMYAMTNRMKITRHMMSVHERF